VRRQIRTRHYSASTERVYARWVARFIFFNELRHPDELGAREVTNFLSWLATDLEVSASTQNQALAAILFLYREVLGRDLDWMDQIVRAKRPLRLPVVLTREEVTAVLQEMDGVPWLLAALM
jgi:site-specific recombinase XerD